VLVRNTTLTLAALLLLTSCAAAPPIDSRPHGYVEGAAELAEPQLHLAAVSAAGDLTLIDLLDESSETIAEVDAATEVTTDGRYVFAASATGVTIVDSGVWTVDHEDHFHYYRATPRVVATIEGGDGAVVSSGTLATSIFFPESGEAVLLDSAALGTGSIEELARIPGEAHDGLAIVHGETVLVTTGSAVRAFDLDGAALDHSARCTDPSGSITTRVGAVIGCAEGALLYTDDFELIPYPTTATRALTFDNRSGRPTVAAVSGDTGYWMLDTRNRTWTHFASPALLQVAAVDDREGHVVALAADGRVLVFDAAGTQLAATEPLSTNGRLTVDASRAYLNAPEAGVVFEIDYADGARIARDFQVDAAFLVETGR